MNGDKVYAVVLLVIAFAGFIVFYSAYTAFDDATQDYTTFCGQEYLFPITMSNITYDGKAVFTSANGTVKEYNLTLIVKPQRMCVNPYLAYGMAMTSEFNGTVRYVDPYSVWPIYELAKPLPAEALKSREPVSFPVKTNNPPYMFAFTLEYAGDTIADTRHGAWSGLNYTVSEATKAFVTAATQGSMAIDSYVVYDSETGVPVIIHVVMKQNTGDQAILHFELEKIDEPKQVRLDSLVFASIASGLALGYAARELLA